MIPDEVKKFLKDAGSKGGKKTAEKYDKETRREWGKRGGRPKKGKNERNKVLEELVNE